MSSRFAEALAKTERTYKLKVDKVVADLARVDPAGAGDLETALRSDISADRIVAALALMDVTLSAGAVRLWRERNR